MAKGIYVIAVKNFNTDEIRVNYRIARDTMPSVDEIDQGPFGRRCDSCAFRAGRR